MKRIFKTFALLLAGAAISISTLGTASATNTDPEPQANSVESENPAGFIEVPNDSYFYQHILDRDGNPKSDLPVIIDFNASWCGPCQKLKPILKKFAAEYDGEVIVYSVDIDKVHAQDNFFEFETIPYVVFLASDGSYEDYNGVMTEQQILEYCDKAFGGQE